MVKRTGSLQRKYKTPPGEARSLDRKLGLICKRCGNTDSYDVGIVCVDPKMVDKVDLAEATSFTGYFHCTTCGAAGGWQFPKRTKAFVNLLLLRLCEDRAPSPLMLGETGLFDGTKTRYGTDAVAHLQRLIEEKPDDAFLWNRLGNSYRMGCCPDLAKAPYYKALSLDPSDVESSYSLAEILVEDGDVQGSVEFLHGVIRHAWKKKGKIEAGLLRDMVRNVLRMLLELHENTDGQVKVFPESSVDEKDSSRDDVELEFFELDLGTEEGVEELVSMVLRERRRRSRVRSFARRVRRGGLATVDMDRVRRLGRKTRSSQFLATSTPARNGPCPCGSGSKFKNCCGRSRP